MVNHNVSETQVPPVDNFFLDMNGIIHNCTHGNDEDATRALSEAEMVCKILTFLRRFKLKCLAQWRQCLFFSRISGFLLKYPDVEKFL